MKTKYVLEADWRVAVYNYCPQRARWLVVVFVCVDDSRVPEEVRTALLMSHRLGVRTPSVITESPA